LSAQIPRARVGKPALAQRILHLAPAEKPSPSIITSSVRPVDAWSPGTEVELCARDTNAQADVEPGRALVADSIGGAGLRTLDVQQVLEVRSAGLEAIGVDVRQVVRVTSSAVLSALSADEADCSALIAMVHSPPTRPVPAR
jgi:hypothetical protein